MALKKVPNPTFDHEVEIPVPGEKPFKGVWTFKYMSKAQYDAFMSEREKSEFVESSTDFIVDWPKGIKETFGPFATESLQELIDAYPGTPGAIMTGFVKGLFVGKSGN